jgi:hypothetical protein
MQRGARNPSRRSFAFLSQRDDPDPKTCSTDFLLERGAISPRQTAFVQAALEKPNSALHRQYGIPLS